MNGAVIIPARFESSRFPGKPLIDIHGKPMIRHVYEKCVQAVGSQNTIIATDDNKIKEISNSFGAKVVMTSSDCLTGTDRIAEANKILGLDFVINVQGDEPMTKPDDVKMIYSFMKNNSENVLNCFCKINKDEVEMASVPKVVVSETNKLIYMSRSGVPFNKNLEPQANYKQVCIYGFSKKHLELFSSNPDKTMNEKYEDLEILRFLDLDIPVQMFEVEPGGIAVDTPEDLERVLVAMDGN